MNNNKYKNVVENIQDLINQNKELEEINYNLKLTLDKLQTRDRLYMSELQNIKNNLEKFARNIDTTPHSSADEYQKFYEYEHKVFKYKEIFEKVKGILEYYADSKIGKLQPDGTYMFAKSKNTGCINPKTHVFNYDGGDCITYDPRPAKEALEIIKECKE